MPDERDLPASIREREEAVQAKTGDEAGIEQPFYVKWAQAIVVYGREVIGRGLGEWIDGIFARFNSEGADGYDAYLNRVVNSMEGEGAVDAKLRRQIRGLIDLPFPIDYIGIYFVWTRLQIVRFTAWMSGIAIIQTQEVNEDLRPNVIDAQTLARFAQIYPGATAVIDPWLDRLGIPDEQQTFLKGVMRQFPNVGETLTLINRKEINSDEALRILSAHGFAETDATRLLELRYAYPSLTDWASLAGREAFEQDQVDKFDLDAGFDEIPSDTYERAGANEEIARWYWRAHWTNVSPQQFFEMIHRQAPKPDGTPWSLGDLADYIRLADISPIWETGLTAIAYRPLTRVDVRRMYEDNVLDYDQVKESYRNLGYSPDDQTVMADWTKAYKERGQRQLTRTQIEKIFELRQITRVELATMLELIGYDTEEAETISLLKDAEREEKRLRSLVRRTEYEYKRQMITKLEASRQLIDEDVQGDQIEELLAEWDNERIYEQALPSKDDLLGWLSGPDFTDRQFRAGMRALRYTDENIDRYLQQGDAKLSKTDILRLFDQEEILEERAQKGLQELGYSGSDTTALLGPVRKRIDRRREREQAEMDRD